MSQDDELKQFNRPLIAEFRANGGRVSGWEDQPLLLLTTIGAKSGQAHTTPLTYSLDGERIVIVGAHVGAATHPAWYFNLLAHPEVTVEVGGETWQTQAVISSGPERERLFEQHARAVPIVIEYQAMARRLLPVIILTRPAST